MGVWDMMYLMREYKKALEESDFPKAEDLRLQMARYLERVEKRQVV